VPVSPSPKLHVYVIVPELLPAKKCAVSPIEYDCQTACTLQAVDMVMLLHDESLQLVPGMYA
jgi:hypothetical protein